MCMCRYMYFCRFACGQDYACTERIGIYSIRIYTFLYRPLCRFVCLIGRGVGDYWTMKVKNTCIPHQRQIHPRPPPQRCRPLRCQGMWQQPEQMRASSSEWSPSKTPGGTQRRNGRKPSMNHKANVNIVCYPIREIKHVNLSFNCWVFCCLNSAWLRAAPRQMELQCASKSSNSQWAEGGAHFTSSCAEQES